MKNTPFYIIGGPQLGICIF